MSTDRRDWVTTQHPDQRANSVLRETTPYSKGARHAA
jgi:hypothetical protein